MNSNRLIAIVLYVFLDFFAKKTKTMISYDGIGNIADLEIYGDDVVLIKYDLLKQESSCFEFFTNFIIFI